MYQKFEERSVQKTDEKPIYKKLPGTILFLIPTILVILLFGAILGAIAGFKSTPEMLENGAVNVAAKDTGDRQITEEIIFKVQVLSSKNPLESNSTPFKGLKNVWEYKDGGLYKYTIGNKRDIKSASALQLEIRKKGFSDAFVVAFKNGKRIPVKEALRLLN
jgi:hypothetical protein